MVELEKFNKNGREASMMRDTGASLTLICTGIWRRIGEPTLEEIRSGIETYDHHKTQYLGAFFSKALSENTMIGPKRALGKVDKNFGSRAATY